MDGQNALTPLDVRTGNNHTTIETARSEQGRIQHIRPVCGRDQDHAFVRLKSVHLDQKLVQCLFAFVMTAT